MNPLNPAAPGHDITRRNFKKKSALTVGAITILAQGGSLANTSSNTTCTTDLISIEVLFNQQTDITSQEFYDSEPEALEAGRARLATLISGVFENRNPVTDCIEGKTPCAELIPNAGPAVTLVTAIQSFGKWKYVINVPSTGTWLVLRFWK